MNSENEYLYISATVPSRHDVECSNVLSSLVPGMLGLSNSKGTQGGPERTGRLNVLPTFLGFVSDTPFLWFWLPKWIQKSVIFHTFRLQQRSKKRPRCWTLKKSSPGAKRVLFGTLRPSISLVKQRAKHHFCKFGLFRSERHFRALKSPKRSPKWSQKSSKNQKGPYKNDAKI